MRSDAGYLYILDALSLFRRSTTSTPHAIYVYCVVEMLNRFSAIRYGSFLHLVVVVVCYSSALIYLEQHDIMQFTCVVQDMHMLKVSLRVWMPKRCVLCINIVLRSHRSIMPSALGCLAGERRTMLQQHTDTAAYVLTKPVILGECVHLAALLFLHAEIVGGRYTHLSAVLAGCCGANRLIDLRSIRAHTHTHSA